MSDSVTVIAGKIWTNRSVTMFGNNIVGEGAGGEGREAKRSKRELSGGTAKQAGDAPWDSYEGRNFSRRTRTL